MAAAPKLPSAMEPAVEAARAALDKAKGDDFKKAVALLKDAGKAEKAGRTSEATLLYMAAADCGAKLNDDYGKKGLEKKQAALAKKLPAADQRVAAELKDSRTLFDEHDADNLGTIDEEEFSSLMESMLVPRPWGPGFAAMDKEKKGAVSYEQLSAWMAETTKQQSSEAYQAGWCAVLGVDVASIEMEEELKRMGLEKAAEAAAGGAKEAAAAASWRVRAEQERIAEKQLQEIRGLENKVAKARTEAEELGCTSLHVCARDDMTDVCMQLLVSDSADHTGDEATWGKRSAVTPLWVAAERNSEGVAGLLLQDGRADVNAASDSGSTPLYIAASKNSAAVAKLLLQDKRTGVTIAQKDGCSPLYICAQKDHAEVAQLLLGDRRTTTKVINQSRDSGATPLYIAAQQDSAEVAKLLLEDKRTDVNAAKGNDVTPLFIAAEKNSSAVAQLLLQDKRTNVNKPNSQGATPLFVAAQENNATLVHMLLEDERVDVNKARDTGATPLYIAAANDSAAVAELLLADPRTEVNQAKNDGWTPLHVAAEKGTSVAKMLWEHKQIELNQATKKGSTALYIAAQENNLALAKLLLRDMRTEVSKERPHSGLTPLDIALKQGHEEMAELLRGAHAQAGSKSKATNEAAADV